MTAANPTLAQSLKRIGILVAVLYGIVCVVMFFLQRALLYFPTHEAPSGQLSEWIVDKQLIGFCHIVENPETIWLMTHGNGGQACDRDYVLKRISPRDSLYVLEYPGYGRRPGTPSRDAFDLAARHAYEQLAKQFPDVPLCVIGESIGSGPACSLANASRQPEKIVLLVPFDSLHNVAASRFYFLPVWLLLRDRWDNVKALSAFTGPVEIFAAENDEVIPARHAASLAAGTPISLLHLIPGGHNDWSYCDEVQIKR